MTELVGFFSSSSLAHCNTCHVTVVATPSRLALAIRFMGY